MFKNLSLKIIIKIELPADSLTSCCYKIKNAIWLNACTSIEVTHKPYRKLKTPEWGKLNECFSSKK